jgi:ketosteroid isomerase-like protein
MPTNKEIVQGAYAAFAEGDVPKVLAAMDDKIEWTDAEGFPLYTGTLIGPQQIVEGIFARLGEVGDDFAVHPTRFVAEGDTVVATGTYTWKHRSTGEPAEVQMAHVWTVRDGKLASFQQHVDTLKVQERSS